jgi:hypothetical protein
MRKIVTTLIVASFLSVAIAAPVFAHGWGGTYRGGDGGVNLLWPITAVLAVPAAVIGTVAHVTVQVVGYTYAPPPIPAEPDMYSGPVTYYAPGAYYPVRSHRGNGCGW